MKFLFKFSLILITFSAFNSTADTCSDVLENEIMIAYNQGVLESSKLVTDCWSGSQGGSGCNATGKLKGTYYLSRQETKRNIQVIISSCMK